MSDGAHARRGSAAGWRWSAAALALVVAGWIHLAIAPEHFGHAPAHGLLFGGLGLLQLGWVAALLAAQRFTARTGGKARDVLRLPGLWLSGGAVVLWSLTQLLRPPFAFSPEPIDAATVWSKLAELVAGVCLLVPMARPLARAGAWPLVRGGAWAVLSGVMVWAGGMLAEPRYPELEMQAEGADGHDHVHGAGAPVPSFAESARAATRLVAALLVRSEYDWRLPPGFPPPRVPQDNPMTAAKVELGRHLFYDVRLSGNGEGSCASCHRQELAFSDGEVTAIGSTGEHHPRNSMALVNVAYNASLTWGHPTLERIEDQVLIPMFGTHPIELGITGNENLVLARLRAQQVYRELFARAFPGAADPFTWERVSQALACFTRALISGGSAYDRFVYQGETAALSESARRGLAMFLSEDFECHHCHGGFNFSVSTVHAGSAFVEKVFHNTGLYDLGGGAYPRGNRGIFELTNLDADMGKFRPPTLRNVAVTAPYMHDGSIATLEEVIDTYAAGGRNLTEGPLAGDGRKNPHKSGFVPGFRISEQEKNDLLAFLRALTDEGFLDDPRFENPF